MYSFLTVQVKHFIQCKLQYIYIYIYNIVIYTQHISLYVCPDMLTWATSSDGDTINIGVID